MVNVNPSGSNQTVSVSAQGSNQISSVSVSDSNKISTVQGVNNLSQYYADLSRQWAISNTIVSNTDYSSKYYANKSKEYKEYTEGVLEDVISAEQSALNAIQTAKTVAITDIDAEAALKITEITSTASDFEDDLTALTERAEGAATNANTAMMSASAYANASYNSASEANTAKTQAQTAVTNAQNYANNASQSATQANTYMTYAETAQRNANSFANQAQGSASAASTSETRARQYATIASESAGRAEAAEQDVQQIKDEIESELDNYVPKTTEVNGKTLNGNITLNASDVGALADTIKYGKSIAYSLDSTTYVLTLTLKDQYNNTLNSVNIDLPLESYILSVSYDNTTKELVISYQNGSTIRVPIGDIIGGLQTEITSTNMLSSDLVDDTNNTHKFATASQLQQITTNTTNIETINNTIGGYGNIVTRNANEFATSVQGAKADTAIQKIEINGSVLTPDINNKVAFTVPLDTGDLTNNAGYIKGITGSDVISALGYTPYNSTNPNGYITSAALNGYATENFVTSQGYITGINSSDVITALGYTPYSNANPDGYITSAALAPYALTSSLAIVATSGSYNDLDDKPTIPSAVTESTVSDWGFTKNTGTVTSVNNVSPVSGNVTLSIPDIEAYTAAEVQTLWSSI